MRVAPNRRWVMIELGPHCEIHILLRRNGGVDGIDATAAARAGTTKGNTSQSGLFDEADA
ncbi:hypothetical protein D8B24_06975 [Verminephrobacter aporrectodeae subsp. tuberculatae]|nr:hypothetical protein [Verminephrobacter aporrectodeae subsp. tuberculatae]